MTSAMSTFVGIDLGTTNSVVAYRNRYGHPEVIANREGQNITPSVTYFGSSPLHSSRRGTRDHPMGAQTGS